MEFKNSPWHFGTKHANEVLEWLSCDTKENFEKLIKDSAHKNYFNTQGWLEPGAITYRINSQGFRGEEFQKNQQCVVTLGCSYTIGLGLPEKDIWPTLVGKELGLVTYNLSWGGIGADTCYRLAEYWIPLLKPELVVMLTPPKSRLELLTIDNDIQAEVFLPSSESCMFSDKDMFLKNWFANQENAEINNRKNSRAVKQLCNELKINCLTYNAHDFMAQSREKVGYARDYMHAGTIAHQMILEQVKKDHYGKR
jgi:hypothetical protein